jgi:predicted NAD/FAD-dependent oxidoreductase
LADHFLCIFIVNISEDKDIGPSLLVHASVQFTLKHIHEDVDQVCTEHILPRVHELLPQLPKSTFITNHLWQVSQVHHVTQSSYHQ